MHFVCDCDWSLEIFFFVYELLSEIFRKVKGLVGQKKRINDIHNDVMIHHTIFGNYSKINILI